MPTPIVSRFADVVAALQPPEFGFTDRHDDPSCVELSNRMRSEGILTVRNTEWDDPPETIERELEFRVWTGDSAIDGIRHELRDTGTPVARPPKVFLPPGPDVTNPLPSRPAFIASPVTTSTASTNRETVRFRLPKTSFRVMGGSRFSAACSSKTSSTRS